MSGMNTSIYLDEELLMELDEQAEQNGVSRNGFIKTVLEACVDSIADKTPIIKRNKTIYNIKVELAFEGK